MLAFLILFCAYNLSECPAFSLVSVNSEWTTYHYLKQPVSGLQCLLTRHPFTEALLRAEPVPDTGTQQWMNKTEVSILMEQTA